MDTFFPEKDRMELAMLLNSFLASPSFETWQEGTPLDIQQLLYTKDGKPRHSIFYMAHLDDNERMFFVTLLFTAVESWMSPSAGPEHFGHCSILMRSWVTCRLSPDRLRTLPCFGY